MLGTLQSPNCDTATSTVSTFVFGRATHPTEPRCTLDLPVTFSCQNDNNEKPDQTTDAHIRSKLAPKFAEMNCDASKMTFEYQTTFVGSHNFNYSGQKLIELGMTSNCHALGNDINQASHTVFSECYNQYDMTDIATGRRVRDYNKKFSSRLLTCDVSDGAMDQVVKDSKRATSYLAEQRGFKFDSDENLACQFSILPTFT